MPILDKATSNVKKKVLKILTVFTSITKLFSLANFLITYLLYWICKEPNTWKQIDQFILMA